MEKEVILELAEQLLQAVQPSDLETAQISTTTYDDGSKSVSIELSYPATIEN